MAFYTERVYHPDPFYKFCIGTELKFVFFPRRCHLSGKYIWLKRGYKKTAMYTGPGDPIFEHRWFSKDEYLIAKLKGDI